jgi:hypothetical protein
MGARRLRLHDHHVSPVDIQRSFTVDKALAGALGTITLIFRVAGGIGAGGRRRRRKPADVLILCTRSSRFCRLLNFLRHAVRCAPVRHRDGGAPWECRGAR